MKKPSSGGRAKGTAGDAFKQRKLKVGARKLASANVTNTSFKYATLAVPTSTEALGEARDSEASFKDLLSNTRHHNVTSRRESLISLTERLESQRGLLLTHLAVVIAAITDRVADPEPAARTALLPLLDVVAATTPVEALTPFVGMLSAFLASALTKLHTSTRLDALSLVAALVSRVPSATLALTDRLYPLITTMLEPQLHTLVCTSHVVQTIPRVYLLGGAADGTRIMNSSSGGGDGGIGSGGGGSTHPEDIPETSVATPGDSSRQQLSTTNARTRRKLTSVEGRLAAAYVLRRVLLHGADGACGDTSASMLVDALVEPSHGDADSLSGSSSGPPCASFDWSHAHTMRSGSRAASNAVVPLPALWSSQARAAALHVPLDSLFQQLSAGDDDLLQPRFSSPDTAPAPAARATVSASSSSSGGGAYGGSSTSAEASAPTLINPISASLEGIGHLVSLWSECNPSEAHNAGWNADGSAALYRLALVAHTTRLLLQRHPHQLLPARSSGGASGSAGTASSPSFSSTDTVLAFAPWKDSTPASSSSVLVHGSGTAAEANKALSLFTTALGGKSSAAADAVFVSGYAGDADDSATLSGKNVRRALVSCTISHFLRHFPVRSSRELEGGGRGRTAEAAAATAAATVIAANASSSSSLGHAFDSTTTGRDDSSRLFPTIAMALLNLRMAELGAAILPDVHEVALVRGMVDVAAASSGPVSDALTAGAATPQGSSSSNPFSVLVPVPPSIKRVTPLAAPASTLPASASATAVSGAQMMRPPKALSPQQQQQTGGAADKGKGSRKRESHHRGVDGSANDHSISSAFPSVTPYYGTSTNFQQQQKQSQQFQQSSSVFGSLPAGFAATAFTSTGSNGSSSSGNSSIAGAAAGATQDGLQGGSATGRQRNGGVGRRLLKDMRSALAAYDGLCAQLLQFLHDGLSAASTAVAAAATGSTQPGAKTHASAPILSILAPLLALLRRVLPHASVLVNTGAGSSTDVRDELLRRLSSLFSSSPPRSAAKRQCIEFVCDALTAASSSSGSSSGNSGPWAMSFPLGNALTSSYPSAITPQKLLAMNNHGGGGGGGGGMQLPPDVSETWLKAFPRVLWSLGGSSLEATDRLLRVLHSEARSVTHRMSPWALLLRGLTRQLVTLLYTVSAATAAAPADANDTVARSSMSAAATTAAAAAAASSSLTSPAAPAVDTVSTTPPAGVFGPFITYPARTQLQLLSVLQQTGGLTRPLRRGLCVVARRSDVSVDVCSAALFTGLHMAASDLSEACSCGIEHDLSSTSSCTIHGPASLAALEPASFLFSYLLGREVEVNPAGPASLLLQSPSPHIAGLPSDLHHHPQRQHQSLLVYSAVSAADQGGRQHASSSSSSSGFKDTGRAGQQQQRQQLLQLQRKRGGKTTATVVPEAGTHQNLQSAAAAPQQQQQQQRAHSHPDLLDARSQWGWGWGLQRTADDDSTFERNLRIGLSTSRVFMRAVTARMFRALVREMSVALVPGASAEFLLMPTASQLQFVVDAAPPPLPSPREAAVVLSLFLMSAQLDVPASAEWSNSCSAGWIAAAPDVTGPASSEAGEGSRAFDRALSASLTALLDADGSNGQNKAEPRQGGSAEPSFSGDSSSGNNSVRISVLSMHRLLSPLEPLPLVSDRGFQISAVLAVLTAHPPVLCAWLDFAGGVLMQEERLTVPESTSSAPSTPVQQQQQQRATILRCLRRLFASFQMSAVWRLAPVQASLDELHSRLDAFSASSPSRSDAAGAGTSGSSTSIPRTGGVCIDVAIAVSLLTPLCSSRRVGGTSTQMMTV